MSNFGSKCSMILFFICYLFLTSEAQLLLPVNDNIEKKVQSHKAKETLILLQKKNIEFRQSNPPLDTVRIVRNITDTIPNSEQQRDSKKVLATKIIKKPE